MGRLHWIDLAQDRDRWRVPVDAVINDAIHLHQNAGKFLTS